MTETPTGRGDHYGPCATCKMDYEGRSRQDAIDQHDDWEDHPFAPTFERGNPELPGPTSVRQQRMVLVEARAYPKLDGVWTDGDQLGALAEAAFNLATTGANGGWVWLRQVHGQPPTEWVSEDSEEYPTPTEGELNADPTVVAWARFDCGDPETTVTL
jgi:hypothetical protein